MLSGVRGYNCYLAKSSNLNFHPLEVMSGYRDPQNDIFVQFETKHLQILMFKHSSIISSPLTVIFSAEKTTIALKGLTYINSLRSLNTFTYHME